MPHICPYILGKRQPFGDRDVAMTCDQIPQLASAYIGREMAMSMRLRMAMHLAQCKSCQAYMRGFRRARDLAAQSLRTPAPDALLAALDLDERR